jgi:hypothetical protein
MGIFNFSTDVPRTDWADIDAFDHCIQLYEEDAHLLDAVGRFKPRRNRISRCSSFLVLTFDQGESGSGVDRSSSR